MINVGKVERNKAGRSIKHLFRAPALDGSGPAAEREAGKYEAHVQVSSHHFKERKVIASSLMINHHEMGNENSPFDCWLSSPMDAVRVQVVPVARFSQKALEEAHALAVERLEDLVKEFQGGRREFPARLAEMLEGLAQAEEQAVAA